MIAGRKKRCAKTELITRSPDSVKKGGIEMSRKLYRFWVWLFVILALEVFAAFSLIAQEDLLERSVVHVIAEKVTENGERTPEHGSGVVVHVEPGGQNYVLTCNHVVDGAQDVKLEIDGRLIPVSIQNVEPLKEMDLALLFTQGEDLPERIIHRWLPGLIEREALEGPVSAYGYSSGGEFEGFSGKYVSIASIWILYDGGEIPDGYSGGPLLNQHGQLIGINRGYRYGNNCAVRVDKACAEIREVLKNRIWPRPTEPGKEGIWIARLEKDYGNDAQTQLSQQIESYIKDFERLRDKVEIRDLERYIVKDSTEKGHAEARRLGKKVNAAIVLWGKITRVKETWTFWPRLTVVSGTELSRKDMGTWIEEPQSTEHPPASARESVHLAEFIVAYSYYESGRYGDKAEFDEALRHFKKLRDHYQAESPKEKSFTGDILFMLGNAHWYMDLRCERGSEVRCHLEDAIKCYDRILESPEYQDAIGDLRRTRVRHNRGVALLDMPQSWLDRILDRLPWVDGNREKAVKSFEWAIDVYRRMGERPALAKAQSNLAKAHRMSCEYEKCKQAVTICQKALEIFSEDAYPLEHLAVKNTLGSSYLFLSRCRRFRLFRREGWQDNLEKAVETFEDAMEVSEKNKEEIPVLHAVTLYNWGLVCECLPDDDERKDFRKMAEAYKEALDIFTEYEFWQYAEKAERCFKKTCEKLKKYKQGDCGDIL